MYLFYLRPVYLMSTYYAAWQRRVAAGCGVLVATGSIHVLDSRYHKCIGYMRCFTKDSLERTMISLSTSMPTYLGGLSLHNFFK